MDNRLEIVNSLLSLGKQCEYLAKLLASSTFSELSPKTELIQLPDMSRAIDICEFELWPAATESSNLSWIEISRRQAQSVGFNFCDCKILEYSNGQSVPIGHAFKNSKVDLICNNYKFGANDQPQLVRIVSSFEEIDDLYDVGIIYESLEFDQDPVVTLLKMKQRIKPHGKTFVRFRPWSSRDGGFQSRYFNKAFAHLLIDLESNELVRSKVIRPIAKYESIMNAAKLQILSRKINSIPPDDHITKNKEYMSTLIKRTWGVISEEEAIKIMSTTSVDFLVST